METITISKTTTRRFVLGRQGLWPGRRWVGEVGTAEALRTIEEVQMDPLNVVARSHDIVLWSRVRGYQSAYLDHLLYYARQFFDYSGGLHIYPMTELPFWRLHMRRREQEARWADFAATHQTLLDDVRAQLRLRGPLGNRDFAGGKRIKHYRGGKETALALYYLWLTGEVIIHHRQGFERIYDVTAVEVEGSREHWFVLSTDVPILSALEAGGIPERWRPLASSTDDEAVFLAPLDIVSTRGRARWLFDFEYLWEVYKPAAKRRWGYYTLPILYGDRLVAQLDPRLDRATATLVLNSF